jgi:ankyrin repeat protein
MNFQEIHKLIKRGDIIALRKLLDEGLTPNLSNKYSWTLLMLAALEGNNLLGELLISRGADLNKLNDFGETALSLAAHQGHLLFVDLLLKNGASKDCSPHGVSLEQWMTSSGLSEQRIALILNRIKHFGTDPSTSNIQGL